jgi:protein SCO1
LKPSPTLGVVPRRPQLALLALAALALVAVVVAIAITRPSGEGSRSVGSSSHSASSSGFDGAALPAGTSAPPFALADQHGHSVSLTDYRGRVAIVAFVSSSCGAPCVVLAQQIRGALDELADQAPVLFVSADPAADTPARVAAFLARVSLAGRALYLTGPLTRLRPLWRSYHVVPYERAPTAFARSASVLLVDGRGRERVIFGLEQLTPESLAHDIRRLQAG